MKYELRPHKWNEEYRYDGGWSIYDTVEQCQVGWYMYKQEASRRVEERNAEEATCTATPTPS